MDREGVYSKTLHNFLSTKNKGKHDIYNNFRITLYDNVDKKKVESLYTKKSVGFFATQEYIGNESFIKYIKKLYEELPEVTFKAFYFTQEQKHEVEALFRSELSRFDFIIPSNIYDVLQEIEIFTGPDAAISSEMIKELTQYTKNIMVLVYPNTENEAQVQLNELGSIKKESIEYDLLIHMGIEVESIEKLQFKYIITLWHDFFIANNIDYTFKHDIGLGDFIIDIIELSLKYPSCKKHLVSGIYQFFKAYNLYK